MSDGPYFTCGRRLWSTHPEDHYRASGGCSYCGSLDPSVLMARLEEGTITLGATDKDYKVYVTNSGGAPLNAMKFYFQHLSKDQMIRFIDHYNERRLKFDGGMGFYRFPFFMGSAA